ncbi:MAG TPA: SseB family protein [Paracoccaceae bacterium]|nr:SseB family protein [Paracoccaceae bacterium]
MSALDAAQAAMEAAPDSEAARRDFWALLAATELWLVLGGEPEEGLVPLVLRTAEGDLALAFDSEERLAGFVEAPTPWACLSGRRVVAMLAGQGIGLGLNLGAAAGVILPADALAWAAEMLGQATLQERRRPVRIGPPRLDEARVRAIDMRLAAMAGMAAEAWLATACYDDGSEAPVLVLTGVAAAAQAGMAAALAEAHRLSGGQGVLDIVFPEADSPWLPALRRQGLGFEIPALAEEPRAAPRPPRLR